MKRFWIAAHLAILWCLVLSLAPVMAAAGGTKRAVVIDVETVHETAEAPKVRRKQWDGDLGQLGEQLCAFQKSKNSYNLITYDDEVDNPAQATIRRGEKGIEGNLEVLGIIGNNKLGKNKVEQVLKGVIKNNTLKFRDAQEKTAWIQTMRKRWLNMARIVSQAEAKKTKPAWTKMLPWNSVETAGDQDYDDNDDGVVMTSETQQLTDEESEPADDEKGADEDGFFKPAGGTEDAMDDPVPPTLQLHDEDGLQDGQGNHLQATFAESQFASELEQKREMQSNIPASDTAAFEHAANCYDLKFSTELMIPMRKPTAPDKSKEPWEPGVLMDFQNSADTELAQAKWPDGFVGELPVQISYLKGLQRKSGGGNQSAVGMENVWEGTHCTTNHKVRVAQRTDRSLLMVIYEQARQICQVRVDAFDKNMSEQVQRLPADHPVIVMAGEFMTTIAKDFCEDKIKKEDLLEARKTRLGPYLSRGSANEAGSSEGKGNNKGKKKGKNEGKNTKKDEADKKDRADTKKDEAGEADTKKDEADTNENKADTKKGDTKKADTKKADTKKADTKKKADAKKADTNENKADAKKADMKKVKPPPSMSSLEVVESQMG